MGILEKLLNRKPKSQPTRRDEPVKRETTEQTQEGNMDLSKKIGLNFTKLNLDKKDVRDKTTFLLDVSGSMAERVNGTPKIKSLRDVMSKYSDAKMMVFSSDAEYIEKASDIPEPDGGTDLAYALQCIASTSPLPERIVLVSDGEPNNDVLALKKAKNLNIPIDIIFIGTVESRGENFMEQLARTTDGQNFVV